MNHPSQPLWSEKSKSAMHAKAESGTFPGCAPMGYLNGESRGVKRIFVDTGDAEKVVRLFEFAAEGMSLSRIRMRAYAMGLKARNGKILGRSSIHAMLTNPFYVGKLRYGGKLIQGVHQPIVSQDLFEQVQIQLAAKSKNRSVNYSPNTGLEPAEPENVT